MERSAVKTRKRGRRWALVLLLLLLAAFFVIKTPTGQRLLLELRLTDCPDELLTLVHNEPAALNFVLGWEKGKESAYSAADIDLRADIGEGIPLLLQWDKRWGYAPYGSSAVAISGCGPTCVSMAVVGLTGNADANPLAVANYSESQGWYIPGAGTSWELMRSGAAHYGLQWEELANSRESLLSALDGGKCVIASMKPGDFTTGGHFIVISGYEDTGLVVRDPNSPTRSEKLWGYSVIAPQIAALWAYTA